MIALGIATGCAAARPGVAAPSATPAAVHDLASRRARACAATGLPAPHWSGLPAARIPVGAKLTRIVVRGVDGVTERLVRARIHERPGSAIDSDVVAADIRRIWRLEAFSDVRAEVEPRGSGVELAYVVRERPLLGHVFYDGDRDVQLGVHSGGLYDPARLRRLARALVARARDDGHLRARGRVRGVRVDPHRVDVCVRVQRGPRFVIDRIVFTGNARVEDATLLAQLHTGGGKVNRVGRPYRADLLRQDEPWLTAVYWDRGMLGAHIGTPEVTLHPARGTLTLRIPVEEGPVFHLRKLRFRGRLLSSVATYRKLLGVHRGEVFDRARFQAGLARIRDYHLWRGHRALFVDTEPELDSAHRAIDIVVKVERTK